ncbi:MAG: glycoside hydrolase family 2 TIM barrel-domain containing protein, partial [Gammaproteobacteria bacterium]
MAITFYKAWIKVPGVIFIAALFLATSFDALALGPDKVTTYKDNNGWKLQVNGKDFYVKGVVWGYSPINENYSYNLWGQPEEFIKKVIDKEFSLMKAANVNAIRTFSTMPTKWVTYVYQQYGIMTVINPLMGRYGATVGGVWRPLTDYSDPLTRETLKAEVLDTVKKYKETPGVLMIALGNESNYG